MLRIKSFFLLFLFLLILISVIDGKSQTVSVPLSHWVYDVLERWEIQGYIDGVFNGSRPYTRIETAHHIAGAWEFFNEKPEKFSKVDIQQLYYLTLEFAEELEKLEFTDQYLTWKPRLQSLLNQPIRKFLNRFLYRNHRNFIHLKYQDFNLYSDPVLSFSSQQRFDDENGVYELTRVSNGLLFYGNLGKFIGFYFDLTDNHLKDERWQDQKIPFEVWEESGWPFLTRRNSGDFDFDENVAYLTFNYKYFFLSYGREFNQWGVGHVGNPLLSANAQLYDQIKLVVRYWRFKFTHITAFLQYISPEARISMKSQPHIDQYWSGNRLELDMGEGIQVGISEGVVYGDRSLQLGYLNPLSFFKSLEHYYGDRDNGVLGLDAEWRIMPGIKIFGEWFIDDITTTKLGSDWFGNKFAWQIGTFLVNPFSIQNIDFLIEYTRIKPYVYSHTFQDYNKYKHYDTILGHFIGPNSDDLFMRFRKRFSKFLQIGLDYRVYRHGSNPEDRNVGGDPDRPFQNGDSPNATFLDGIRKKQETYGITIQYEFLRNLIAELHYRGIRNQARDWESLFAFKLSFNFGYRDESFRHIFPVSY